MLYIFGPLSFEVYPFNTHETSRQSGAEFASKAVIGARPPIEFVGEGEEKLTLRCKLYPKKLGGASELEQLNTMRLSGAPYLLMRGDGTVLGWFAVAALSEGNSFLDSHGAPQTIDLEIQLVRGGAPSPASVFDYMSGLF